MKKYNTIEMQEIGKEIYDLKKLKRCDYYFVLNEVIKKYGITWNEGYDAYHYYVKNKSILKNDGKTNKKDSNEKVIDTLKDYYKSKDVFIDTICLKHYKNKATFDSDLKKFCENDLYKNSYYDLYINIKETRFNKFLIGAKSLIEKYENHSLKGLDIALLTGLSISTFKNTILKNEVIDKLGINRSYAFRFTNYIESHFKKHVMSKQEIDNFNYSYNGISIKDYLEDVIVFLESQDFDITQTNLVDTFQLIVNNTIGAKENEPVEEENSKRI